MLEGRLLHALEGVVFALLVAGLFYLIALFARIVSKKTIGSPRYYTIAVVFGFVLHRVLVSVLTVEPPPLTASSERGLVGLDAPFIPPTEANLEAFPAQLDAATAQLSQEEQERLSAAIEFLVFAIGSSVAEAKPEEFDQVGDMDLVAKSLVRLWRFAQKQGNSMTLRKYIDLADEMKREKPDWWAHFQEAQALEGSPSSP